MSEEQSAKAEELKKLLERVQTSSAYESVGLTEKISVLAREVFGKGVPEKTAVPQV